MEFSPQMLVALAYDSEVNTGEILIAKANESSWTIKYMHSARKKFMQPNPNDKRTTQMNFPLKVSPVIAPGVTIRSLWYFLLKNEKMITAEYDDFKKKLFTA